ncbi:MAG: nucleoside deaminase [Clostridia bacterium]|nr:nucleoside deaminase [Clostridia bacterium]
MNNIDDKAIKLAIQESQINKENNYKKGGPFGAVIVKNGKIITSAHNTVIESIDPTAHAEINAIRQASMILKTNDLSECILYTSTEPCPMCLSAIIWSNIKEIYYANTKKDANNIGFRDDIIYDYINGKKQDILKRHHIKSEEALEVFRKFQDIENKTMY